MMLSLPIAGVVMLSAFLAPLRYFDDATTRHATRYACRFIFSRRYITTTIAD